VWGTATGSQLSITTNNEVEVIEQSFLVQAYLENGGGVMIENGRWLPNSVT
jgi:hypothetical protein